MKTHAPVAKPNHTKPKSNLAPGKDRRGKAGRATENPAGKPEPAAAISTDAICLRAYFIAQQRREEGMPGDELSDWLEAERQLLAEKGPK